VLEDVCEPGGVLVLVHAADVGIGRHRDDRRRAPRQNEDRETVREGLLDDLLLEVAETLGSYGRRRGQQRGEQDDDR
jgi:hypothetical protein